MTNEEKLLGLYNFLSKEEVLNRTSTLYDKHYIAAFLGPARSGCYATKGLYFQQKDAAAMTINGPNVCEGKGMYIDTGEFEIITDGAAIRKELDLIYTVLSNYFAKNGDTNLLKELCLI